MIEFVKHIINLGISVHSPTLHSTWHAALTNKYIPENKTHNQSDLKQTKCLYFKYIPFIYLIAVQESNVNQTNHPGPTDMCNTSLSRTYKHWYTSLLRTNSFFSLLTVFCGTYWLTRKKMYNFCQSPCKKSLISHTGMLQFVFSVIITFILLIWV